MYNLPMSPEVYPVVIVTSCVIVWLTIMLPIVVYLFTSWKWRRDDMVTMMSAKVLGLYYGQFFPALKIQGALEDFFRKDFDRRYGRRLYIVPLLLLGGISAAGMVATGSMALSLFKATLPHKEAVAFAALAGGFTWVVSDQLGRFRTRDFTTYDIYNSVFRILVAIPLGYSIAKLGSDTLSVPFAYLLGTFPTATLFTIARRLGSQKLNMSDDASPAGSELEQLPDVGKAFAERLKDEGINSITELAYADPVSLTLRTNKPFTYVTDCISQALLWMYITTGLPKVVVLGLRGAQEVSNLLDDLNSADEDKRADANQTLAAAATLLGIESGALQHTLEEVSGDPYTKFLVEIWSIPSSDPQPPPPETKAAVA
jgi:hypothetical protein